MRGMSRVWENIHESVCVCGMRVAVCVWCENEVDDG